MCDNTADSVWNVVDDDGVVDEEEKKEWYTDDIYI